MAGGFDPKAYLSEDSGSSFDPTAYLAEGDHGLEMVDWKGKGEAALQGFGQGATMGYLPQLQAAAGAIVPDAGKDVDAELAANGFKITQPKDTYLARRDSALDRDQALRSEFPGSYIAGQVGGIVASAPAVGAGLGKLPGMAKPAAGFVGRVAQAAGAGAVQGALQNPGDTKGEVDLAQVDARLSNAKTGAVLGGAVQAGSEIVKKGADLILSVPKRMEDWAALKSFKSAGGVKKHWEAAERGAGADEIGREMLKQGVVKPGATYEDIAKSAGELKQKAGRIIGDTYEQATKAIDDPAFQASLSPESKTLLAQTELNATGIADDLETRLTEQLTGKAGGSKALAAVKSVLDELRQNGQKTSLEKIQEFKMGVDELIKYNKDVSDLPIAKQYLKVVRDELKDRVQNRIGALDKVLGSDRLGSLKEANRQYGIWANAEGAARDRVIRENANRFLSPSDYFTGGVGAAAGFASGDSMESRIKNAAIGSAAALANKGLRSYGNPVVAKAALKTGEALGKIPQRIPNAVGGVASALARNPGVLGAGASKVLNPGKTRESGDAVESETMPPVIGSEPKGYDKWAQRGVDKLGFDGATAELLMSDKQARRLLIEASDLKPGSARMNRIKEQIESLRKDSKNDSLSSTPAKVLRQQRKSSSGR